MKLSDEIRIEAPRERVYAALNNPEILRKSIPGCEELERVSENEFAAVVRAKVGPVSAKFNGRVTLADLNPPEGYTLSGEGKGGAAGFARGKAAVKLDQDGDATILRYDVDATVGGKLAQLGGRLIDNTAKSLSAEFFRNFENAVTGERAPEELAPTVPQARPGKTPVALNAWLIGGGLLLAALLATMLVAF